MRFIKLLDPYEVSVDGSGLSINEQASRAAQRFPDLVQASPLTYWRAGDPIEQAALRLLVGVCPTFDLTNLRILDLMCDRLRTTFPVGVRCDVCNLDDMNDWQSASAYFPGIDSMVPNPIVGIWTLGQHIGNFWGAAATDYLLQAFRLGVTPQELASSVRPPSLEMLSE